MRPIVVVLCRGVVGVCVGSRIVVLRLMLVVVLWCRAGMSRLRRVVIAAGVLVVVLLDVLVYMPFAGLLRAVLVAALVRRNARRVVV